jgi:hypothetical protein
MTLLPSVALAAAHPADNGATWLIVFARSAASRAGSGGSGGATKWLCAIPRQWAHQIADCLNTTLHRAARENCQGESLHAIGCPSATIGKKCCVATQNVNAFEIVA